MIFDKSNILGRAVRTTLTDLETGIAHSIKSKLNKDVLPIMTMLANAIREQDEDVAKDVCLSFRAAGGCMNKQVNDYDLFLPDCNAYTDGNAYTLQDLNKLLIIAKESSIAPSDLSFEMRSKCLTVYTKGVTVQFLTYLEQGKLETLIESFDFAHIKAGVDCVYLSRPLQKVNEILIKDIYISDEYVDAKTRETTYYTVPDETLPEKHLINRYPLSSMIRLNKYKERGLLTRKQYRREFCKIMYEFFERGIYDYEDFKDQLDSIDLALEGPEAYDLWNVMCSRDFVENPDKED